MWNIEKNCVTVNVISSVNPVRRPPLLHFHLLSFLIPSFPLSSLPLQFREVLRGSQISLGVCSGGTMNRPQPSSTFPSPSLLFCFFLSFLPNSASLRTIWWSMLHHIQSPDLSIIPAQRVGERKWKTKSSTLLVSFFSTATNSNATTSILLLLQLQQVWIALIVLTLLSPLLQTLLLMHLTAVTSPLSDYYYHIGRLLGYHT